MFDYILLPYETATNYPDWALELAWLTSWLIFLLPLRPADGAPLALFTDIPCG